MTVSFAPAPAGETFSAASVGVFEESGSGACVVGVFTDTAGEGAGSLSEAEQPARTNAAAETARPIRVRIMGHMVRRATRESGKALGGIDVDHITADSSRNAYFNAR